MRAMSEYTSGTTMAGGIFCVPSAELGSTWPPLCRRAFVQALRLHESSFLVDVTHSGQ